MPSKQLEILVRTRAEGSGFNDAGSAADKLSSKLGGLNELAEAGHGLHSLLRQARNVAVAFEVLPLGIDALKGLFAAATGGAEEAATAQREFYNQIKELPLVGKFLAPAAEEIGAFWAHAFGKESTADLEAEMAKKKASLKDFADTSKKFNADLAKAEEEASTAGMSRADQETSKAIEKYRNRVAAIADLRRKSIAEAANDDVLGAQQANEEANRMQKAADLDRANEIQQAHAAELEENQAFGEKLAEQQRTRLDALLAMQKDFDRSQRNSMLEGIDSQVAGINDKADKQIAALRAALQKQTEENKKDKKGVKDGTGHREQQIDNAQAQAETAESQEEQTIRNQAELEASNARTVYLKQLQVDLQQGLADKGDKDAAAQLENNKAAEEYNQRKQALTKILETGDATQRYTAQKELEDLDQQREKIAALKAEKGTAKELKSEDHADEQLRQAQLDILRQEADQGDKAAEKQLKKLQLQDQYIEQRKKLLAIEKSSASTPEEKKRAASLLSELDSLQDKPGKKKGNAVGPADLEASQYLTGVTARAEQQHAENDPVLEQQKQHTTLFQQMVALLAGLAGGGNKIKQTIPLR